MPPTKSERRLHETIHRLRSELATANATVAHLRKRLREAAIVVEPAPTMSRSCVTDVSTWPAIDGPACSDCGKPLVARQWAGWPGKKYACGKWEPAMKSGVPRPCGYRGPSREERGQSARDLRREAWKCAALILAMGTPVPDALVDASEPEFKRFDAQWQAVVCHARKLSGER